jgi:ketopantoate hydroxymethyltransferase
MEEAFKTYILDVESGSFPGSEHTFGMPDDEWNKLLDEIGS